MLGKEEDVTKMMTSPNLALKPRRNFSMKSVH